MQTLEAIVAQSADKNKLRAFFTFFPLFCLTQYAAPDIVKLIGLTNEYVWTYQYKGGQK
jgi:hypothetical protein